MVARGLDSWIRKLTKQNMPVVGKVIAELNSLTGRDDTEINQLAEVILRDANLTSHVLRVANSVHYNHSSSAINTVSRAIVLIGLKGMRAVCISLLLIDSLLKKGGPRERLLQLMAQGLHAATQARDLVIRQDADAAEEVFIAALLFNLGEMAFLANEKITDENSALLSDNAKDREAAMERVLGTSFKAITRALAKHWKLGETLELALYPGREPNTKVRAVILGERLSRAAPKGWDSAATQKIIAEIAAYTMQDEEQCLISAQESAGRAAEVALHYGAAEVCPLIPSKNTKAPVQKNQAAAKLLRGDAQLQLNILRELTTATAERADVNTIFQMVIEGMHRGIGLERVVVAFIQQHQAKAKYVLGEGTEGWRNSFAFDVGPYSENIFTSAMASSATVWIDAAFISQHRQLYTPDIQQVLGVVPAFVYVLRVGDRTPGLFYADRAESGGTLSKDQFESFRHFASQAQINLNLLSQVVKKTTH